MEDYKMSNHEQEIKSVGVDSVKVRAAAYDCVNVLDKYMPNDKELELILKKILSRWQRLHSSKE